jgi:RNA polymerase sigma-70 factor (ECF subfamily)
MTTDGTLLRTQASLLFRLREAPDDQEAWSRFIARYEPQVGAWCRRWGLQEADAADVVQNVLLRLTQKLRTFTYDPSQRFRGWLKTVTLHALSDYMQAQQRAGHGSGDSGVVDLLKEVEARDDLVERLQTAFDHELLEQAYGQVKARVAERTWRAFELTALEGMKGADAARVLGMNVGAVFVAKSKVQAMLQEIIRAAEDQP